MSFHNWDNCEELEKLCSSTVLHWLPFFVLTDHEEQLTSFMLFQKNLIRSPWLKATFPFKNSSLEYSRYTVDSKPKTTGAHLQNLLNWKYLPWVPIIAQSSVWQPSRYVHRAVLSWKRVFTKIDLCFYLWCKNKKPQKLKYSSRPQD